MKIVKEIACCLLLSVLCLEAFAGNNEVLRFMNIPINCSKATMVRKLKLKGFKAHDYSDGKYLTGQFNGRESMILISETNRKVSHVKVTYALHVGREEVIAIYNELLDQFALIDKYVGSSRNAYIKKDEDIFDGLKKGKTYVAHFFLKNEYEKQKIEQLTNNSNLAAPLHLNNSVEVCILGRNSNIFNIEIIYKRLTNRPNGQDL